VDAIINTARSSKPADNEQELEEATVSLVCLYHGVSRLIKISKAKGKT